MYSTYHSPSEGDRVGSLSQRQEQGKRTVGFLSWVTSPVIKSHREKHLYFLVSKVERSNFALHSACWTLYQQNSQLEFIAVRQQQQNCFLSSHCLNCVRSYSWLEEKRGRVCGAGVAGRRGVQLIVPGHWYRALKCFFFYDKNFKLCTNKKTVVILNTQALSGYTREMSFSVW